MLPVNDHDDHHDHNDYKTTDDNKVSDQLEHQTYLEREKGQGHRLSDVEQRSVGQRAKQWQEVLDKSNKEVEQLRGQLDQRLAAKVIPIPRTTRLLQMQSLDRHP